MSNPMVEGEYADTKTSAGGIEYPYLNFSEVDSATVEYDLVNYAGKAEVVEDNYEVRHLYLSCQELLDEGLPLDANPREPSQTDQVVAMQETLRLDPRDFVKKNNGIVLFATGVDITDDGSSAQITYSNYEGVCNGGHTYFAITTYDGDLDEEAVVHLETIILPEGLQGDDRRQTIIDIAGARNNNNRLEQSSEADFLGYYNEFKNALNEPKIVSWHEGDSNAFQNAFGSVQLIRLLKSLDPFNFYHPVFNEDGSSHKRLSVSKERPHSQWVEEMNKAIRNKQPRPLHFLVPLLNEIFYIRDLISYSLQWDELGAFRRSNLWQEYLASAPHTERSDDPNLGSLGAGERELHYGDFEPPVGLKLKETLDVLFVGLFRSNLFVAPAKEGGVRYTGWYIDPVELWDSQKQKVLDKMREYFRDSGDDPKQFIRSTAPFSEDLFELGFIGEPPSPYTVYDRDVEGHSQGLAYSVRKFEQSEQETEWGLIESETGGASIVEITNTGEDIEDYYRLLEEREISG